MIKVNYKTGSVTDQIVTHIKTLPVGALITARDFTGSDHCILGALNLLLKNDVLKKQCRTKEGKQSVLQYEILDHAEKKSPVLTPERIAYNREYKAKIKAKIKAKAEKSAEVIEQIGDVWRDLFIKPYKIPTPTYRHEMR
jgi:hypothetical protein